MKDLSYSRLFDLYGELLTNRQSQILKDYYNCDLSLGEIAENCGISRQAVHCVLKQAEDSLNNIEQKLGLLLKLDKIEKVSMCGIECLEEENYKEIRKCFEEINEVIRS